MNEHYPILVDRLVSNMSLNMDISFNWNGTTPITFENIEKAIEDKVPYSSIPFGDTFERRPIENKPNEYHISRILYFIHFPDEIKGILIDNKTFNNTILPEATIVDGWHRLFAAIFLKLRVIEARYGGREDILNYLMGFTDEEIIE